jgi:hypothetical protein
MVRYRTTRQQAFDRRAKAGQHHHREPVKIATEVLNTRKPLPPPKLTVPRTRGAAP